MASNSNDVRDVTIRPSTRVLFHIKDTPYFLLTNTEGEKSVELTWVFEADIHGKIYTDSRMLGSVTAHQPEIIPDLEPVGCSFAELNPKYFEARPVVDGLIGQSVGDAFGVPFEFMAREDVRRLDPQDMVGNDCELSFFSRWSDLIPSGAWSDDTSMTIAAMASIINNQGRIDYEDIMRQFVAWWYEGKYSSLSFPFGLGNNISHALDRFRSGTPALECGGTGIRDNGNGALMRMFPFSMYSILKGYDDATTLEVIRGAAGITHAHEINVLGCYVYTQFLSDCMRTRNPQFAYVRLSRRRLFTYPQQFSTETLDAYKMLFSDIDMPGFDPDSIRESGYVVDSLTIAIYSLLKTGTYEDAIKMAVGFGYDTDTNAAITGSIAGVIYGIDQVPDRWLHVLRCRESLVRIAACFEDCVKQ